MHVVAAGATLTAAAAASGAATDPDGGIAARTSASESVLRVKSATAASARDMTDTGT
jgi:hypothetical protein